MSTNPTQPQPDQTLTQDEYETLMVFLAHAKPRANRQKDLAEIANRYTDSALNEILSVVNKIKAAVEAEQTKSYPEQS